MVEPHANVASPLSAQDSKVSVRVLGALLDAVEQAGVPRAQLLRRAELSADALDAPEARIAGTDIVQLCALALELSGDPALGLHWAERLTVDAFAPLSYLVTHAPTLGHALDTLARFASLMSDQQTYEIVYSADSVTIRSLLTLADSPVMQRFLAELSVIGFIHVVRCFHARWQPTQVSFEYPAPEYAAEYARVFQGAERFNQKFTGIVFDRELLEKAALHRDDGIHASLQALAEQRLGRIKRHASYSTLVREQLVQGGPLAQCDMASVAAVLGLSVRSLRRRLADEGASFTDLANETFSVLTRRLLIDQALTIQEAAHALGFSGANAFHRAFKRATGLTPRAFIDAQLGPRRR